jgi:hypothetical protein
VGSRAVSDEQLLANLNEIPDAGGDEKHTLPVGVEDGTVKVALPATSVLSVSITPVGAGGDVPSSMLDDSITETPTTGPPGCMTVTVTCRGSVPMLTAATVLPPGFVAITV